jgi:type VI secretion system protein ImpL
MKKTTTVWILAATALALFLLLGLLLPGLIGLEAASDRWILRGGLWLLGAVAAALLWFWRMPAAKAAAASEPEKGDEIDVLLAAARSRLAGARGAAAARLADRPVLLVVGPGGSAKTTILTRSGLEPELLAGEVYRGDAVVPTGAVNVWIAQDHVVVEAGGRLAGEAGRWRRLIREIRPNRLKAMLPGGKQAPRAVVVCFGCDELLKPGASEAVPAAAQKLRARLAEASQQLGIRLPVYVLFTKADRLPYFEDFVRNFTREEARDVLGVTLTVPAPGAVGAYAERESARIAEAFRSLFRGLALRRLDVLPRETRDDFRAGAYEFPREFRKVTDLATQFLLDLCRPSQLGVSPFLRGFYFTGVRAVFVHDVGAQPQAVQGGGAAAMDATGVFDPRKLQQAAPAPVPVAGSRKVPEWVFHERVFRDVVLKDETVRGVTAGGTKVNLLRRAAFLTAAAASVVFAIGFTWSFFANRALLRDTRAAAESARSLASVTRLPDLATLQGLDVLRARAERLNRHAREGHPLSLGWGLYAGAAVQPEIRQLFFQRFGQLQWTNATQSLTDSLGALPATPTAADAYGPTFDALKAYIVMANRPDQATRDLVPVLMRFWTGGAALDEERARLGEAQFGFYADELPFGNPYQIAVNEPLVARTQAYLCGFSGSEQFYRMLLGQAAAAGGPVRWSDAVLSNGMTVPAEFTQAGWARAQETLGNIQSLFERDTWVVGECVVPVEQRARLEQTLRARYHADYIDHWLRFLQAGRVAGYNSVEDAANKLAVLSTNQSAIIRMLAVVADNTAVDTVAIGKAFLPVHQIVPPKATALTDAAGQYLTGLTGLQAAIAQVAAAAGPMRTQAVLAAGPSIQQVKAGVSGLARGFSTEGEARVVGAAVSTLLQSPVTGVESMMGALPAQEANAKGASFCGPFDQLLGKYPFSPRSASEASLDEVIGVFKPGEGALWSFYESDLQELLLRQGARYVARAGVSPRADRAFVDFFNRAAEISRGLFDDAGDGPYVVFLLRPQTSAQVPEVSVSLDGQTGRFTQTQAAARTFEWRGGAATGASVVARMGDEEVTVARVEPGVWATFRLFQQASRFDRQGSGYVVEWPVPGRSASITAELSFEKGQAIFQREYLSRLGQCVRRIAS